jgi:homoaconitate hydratase
VRGRKVAPGVEFYVAPASSEVLQRSEERGDWQVLLEAGAIPLPPGCGPCIGLGAGTLEDGEVGISATNRNFRGRMGSRDARAYLSSPVVVASSAVSGYIDGPEETGAGSIRGQVRRGEAPERDEAGVEILPGFPGTVEGELLFCHQDNLNTDGIFPGKYTYIDDFTPEQQASVAMENYDPEFTKIAADGDILVGGFNFGTGSSREQAATALKYRGIRLVLAGSFSETYKRNALNNGFLVLEVPHLVHELRERFGASKPTVRTGIDARIDFGRALLEADGKTYRLAPVGGIAQELVIAGGLENWVRGQLGRKRGISE